MLTVLFIVIQIVISLLFSYWMIISLFGYGEASRLPFIMPTKRFIPIYFGYVIILAGVDSFTPAFLCMELNRQHRSDSVDAMALNTTVVVGVRADHVVIERFVNVMDYNAWVKTNPNLIIQTVTIGEKFITIISTK